MNKINWPLCFAIVGGALAIFSALAQWQEKKVESKNTQIAQDSLKTLQQQTLKNTENLAASYKENARLQGVLNSKSDNIITTTNELTTLYKENAKLQEELKNQVTGGDNKPSLRLLTSTLTNEGGKYYATRFRITNLGKYPLNSLKINVVDFQSSGIGNKIKITPQVTGEMITTQVISELEINGAAKEFNIGTLNKSQEEYFYASVYEVGNKLGFPYFTIILSWNNGTLYYNISTEIKDGKLILKNISGTFNGEKVDVTSDLFHLQAFD